MQPEGESHHVPFLKMDQHKPNIVIGNLRQEELYYKYLEIVKYYTTYGAELWEMKRKF